MYAGAIKVEGLRELDRALRELDPEVQRELGVALRAASEPVRARASALAFLRISGMRRAVNSTWWQMRIGGHTSTFVYLAPASRNKGGSPRPNLAGPLLEAMRLGLEQREPAVIAEAELAISRAFKKVGF